MKNLNPEFCRSVRSARRAAGLTQGELASEVGCKQSALSMFEQGDGTKLNDEVIGRIAKKFNLSFTEEEGKADGRPSAISLGPIVDRLRSRAFCPNPACPSNHGYFVEEMRLFRPDNEMADPVGGRYCAMCGELLERKCPNCGAPVHPGAICSLCGQAYVSARN